ncbi:hypothetical protein [Kitasatospora sp. NPDC059571]|uniref:hypothetical protein n=1 Tax=Kitasatospora sp. NPDC059571 TaxID=3346871 RepID=UPI0036780942
MAGGAGGEQAESAKQYGLHIGLAFQLTDDVLGVWGGPRAHRQAGSLRPLRAQEVPACSRRTHERNPRGGRVGGTLRPAREARTS